MQDDGDRNAHYGVWHSPGCLGVQWCPPLSQTMISEKVEDLRLKTGRCGIEAQGRFQGLRSRCRLYALTSDSDMDVRRRLIATEASCRMWGISMSKRQLHRTAVCLCLSRSRLFCSISAVAQKWYRRSSSVSPTPTTTITTTIWKRKSCF